MFTVIHANGNTDSIHETEDDARKQVTCAYGPVFIDEKDRPSGRLRVWRDEQAVGNDFLAAIAKIVLPPEEKPKERTGLKDVVHGSAHPERKTVVVEEHDEQTSLRAAGRHSPKDAPLEEPEHEEKKKHHPKKH